MSDNRDEIMDIKAAADYLHVKERTLYSLVKTRKVPGIKIGGQWRFSKKCLEEMFDQANNKKITAKALS